MQTTISVAVMLCVSAASDAAVSVRDCRSCSDEMDYWKSRVAKPETSSLFTFGYQQGDIFSTRIYLKNKAENVFPEVYIRHILASVLMIMLDTIPSSKIRPWENIKKKLKKINEDSFYRIRSVLSNPEIAIDVELFTETGFCSLKQIANGINLSQPSEKTKRTKYNEVCLRSHWCEIVVDLENQCEGTYVQEFATVNKPQITVKPKLRKPVTYFTPFFKNTFSPSNLPISHKTMETTTYKVTASETSVSVVHETNEPMSATTTANTFKPYVPSPTHTEVPTSRHEDMETTTIKSTASDTNAQPVTSTTNYVIMVNSSIAAAAAVALLVIVAIRTRYWAKPQQHAPHAQGTSQLSTNENDYKLRQNLPIRRDPEYEIIDSEYEIIDTEYEIVDTDENLYEEINL